MILNLVNNVVKFMEWGGVMVECEVLVEEICVCVCDMGIGIKLENLLLLFEVFW